MEADVQAKGELLVVRDILNRSVVSDIPQPEHGHTSIQVMWW